MDYSSLSNSGFTPEEIARLSQMTGEVTTDSKKKTTIKERLQFGAPSSPDALSFENQYQSMEVVEELKKQLTECEVMLQAMWGMLKDHGATSEELNEQLDLVLKVKDSRNYEAHIPCENCGKMMQDIKKETFKYRCLYCGSEKIVNPYDKFEVIERQLEEPAQNIEEISNNEDILNQEFVPYDVSKDLGFDEEDGQ